MCLIFLLITQNVTFHYIALLGVKIDLTPINFFHFCYLNFSIFMIKF